jgi:inorganic pyrophosphatase
MKQMKSCGGHVSIQGLESDFVVTQTNTPCEAFPTTNSPVEVGSYFKWRVRDCLLFCFAVFTLLSTLSACKEPVAEVLPPLFVRYTPSVVLHSNDSIGVFAVVEIPAGTTHLQAIDTIGQVVPIAESPVDFLPFPGNYGFVAGCGKTDSVSGVLSPLPVLVMMHALETQSIVEVKPVAVLVLSKSGKPYPIVMAVPADSTLQSIKAKGFVDFLTEYDATRHILQQWFLNYQGHEMFGFTGWRDEHYAQQLIADWKLKE